MEVRYNELDRAAAIWERLVACHPEPKLWVKWAKWTEERGQLGELPSTCLALNPL
jgi:crooked neck